MNYLSFQAYHRYPAGFQLDLSFESEEQAKKIIEVMEHCVELNIPSVIDLEKGPSWGEVK